MAYLLSSIKQSGLVHTFILNIVQIEIKVTGQETFTRSINSLKLSFVESYLAVPNVNIDVFERSLFNVNKKRYFFETTNAFEDIIPTSSNLLQYILKSRQV